MKGLSRRKLITLLSSIPVLGFLGIQKSEALEGWYTEVESSTGWDTKAKKITISHKVNFTEHYDPEDGKIVVLQYNQGKWEQVKRDPNLIYGNYVGSARLTIDGKEHQKEVMETWCPTDRSHIYEAVTT